MLRRAIFVLIILSLCCVRLPAKDKSLEHDLKDYLLGRDVVSINPLGTSASFGGKKYGVQNWAFAETGVVSYRIESHPLHTEVSLIDLVHAFDAGTSFKIVKVSAKDDRVDLSLKTPDGKSVKLQLIFWHGWEATTDAASMASKLKRFLDLEPDSTRERLYAPPPEPTAPSSPQTADTGVANTDAPQPNGILSKVTTPELLPATPSALAPARQGNFKWREPPKTLDFGEAAVGMKAKAVQNVVLHNNDSIVMPFSNIGIVGESDGSFAQTNDCLPELAANSQCTVTVTFTPEGTGIRTASLVITSPSFEPLVSPLRGIGKPADGAAEVQSPKPQDAAPPTQDSHAQPVSYGWFSVIILALVALVVLYKTRTSTRQFTGGVMFFKSKEQREQERLEREKQEAAEQERRQKVYEKELHRKKIVQELIDLCNTKGDFALESFRTEYAQTGAAFTRTPQEVFFDDFFLMFLAIARAQGGFLWSADILQEVGTSGIPPLSSDMCEIKRNLARGNSFPLFYVLDQKFKNLLEGELEISVPATLEALRRYDKRKGTQHAPDAARVILAFVSLLCESSSTEYAEAVAFVKKRYTELLSPFADDSEANRPIRIDPATEEEAALVSAFERISEEATELAAREYEQKSSSKGGTSEMLLVADVDLVIRSVAFVSGEPIAERHGRLYKLVMQELKLSKEFNTISVKDATKLLESQEELDDALWKPQMVDVLARYDERHSTTWAEEPRRAFSLLVAATVAEAKDAAKRERIIREYAALLAPLGHGGGEKAGASSHSDSVHHEPLNNCQGCPSMYEVLGLPDGAEIEDVKAAYHDLVKVWHPDRFNEGDQRLRRRADAMMKDINAAYEHINGHFRSSGAYILAMDLKEAASRVAEMANTANREMQLAIGLLQRLMTGSSIERADALRVVDEGIERLEGVSAQMNALLERIRNQAPAQIDNPLFVECEQNMTNVSNLVATMKRQADEERKRRRTAGARA